MKTKSPQPSHLGALRSGCILGLAIAVVLLTAHGSVASTLVVWGPGYWGQTNVPAGLTDVIAVSAGQNHVMALKADGTVVAWGGDGSDYQDVNQVPPGLNNVRAISAGIALSVALKFDGTVVAWGYNGSDGSTNVPPGLHDAVAIAAGGYHGLALRANGTVIGWGQSMSDQIDPPEDLTNAIAVAAGSHHSLALRANGTVVAFGSGSQGQINLPPGLSNVIAIAAVDTRSFALKADGTVVQWGNNFGGAFAPPPGLSNVVAISAGYRHTLALRRDGTVVGWGDEEVATVPPGLSNVAAIAANNHVNVALVGPLPPPPLVPRGAVWRYNDTGFDQGTAWRNQGFNDSVWPSGPAQLGFGDGDEATMLNRFAADGITPIVTAYFRRALVVNDVASFTNVNLRLVHDDGAVVYVNGVEAFRVNMPAGPVSYGTFATAVVPDNAVAIGDLNPALLINGTNVVAVEMHQANVVSTDLSFDLELIGRGSDRPPEPVTLAEALDAPELVWRNECYFPPTPWTVETNVTHDGVDAAVTSAYDDESSSCDLVTEVTGPGVVEFFWKVSNTPPFGTLRVSIGGHYSAAITGEVDWQHRSFFVPPGPQTLVWSYFSGNPVWIETGSAWLDEVHFSRTPPVPPSIVVQPGSQNAYEGDDVILSVEAAGTEPFSFQWQRNGSDLPGQTNATLTLPAVQITDAGTYRVRVVNEGNTVFSDGATLTVTPRVLARRSAPRDQVDPSVAANGSLYLVVWTDSRNAGTDYDIYGARVTPDGRVLDPDGIRICSKTNRQEMPAVASDGQDFFVVWQDSRSSDSMMTPELYGTRVTAGGVVINPDGILISSALYAQFYPRLAFNGTHYLVVWYDYRLSTETHRGPDIFGTRVRPDGLVIEPGGIAISTSGDTWDWAPTVASLNGDFLVVWGTSQVGVLGTRVTAGGEVLHLGGIPISPYQIPNRAPLAANATGYLAIWDDDRNYPATQSDIWGRRIAANGETVLPGELSICSAANSQYRSALAASSNEFFCVWMDARSGYDPAKIFATRITTNGVVTPDGFDLGASPPPRSYDNPAVASLNGEYLVVWPGKEGLGQYGPMDMVGVRVSANGTVIETNSFLISSVTPEMPSVTWANPADIVYGTELSSAQLNATASAPGSFRYVPPLGTLLDAGTHTLSVFFTPYDTNAYLPATATTTLHVSRAPLTVTANDQTRYEGQVNPTFTATYVGLAAGETPDQWNDVQYLVTTATSESPPGTYPIEVLDFAPDNYNLTRINGTLTVRPARTQPGSVDLSFDAHIGGIVYAVVVQPDGRILVGGGISAAGGQPRNGLARLNADGSLDSSFVPPADFRFSIQSIARHPDGRFMAAGFTAFNEIHHSFLARFNADGSRDTTFPLVTNMLWDFNSVAVQGDGKVLVAGSRSDGLGSGLLLRFNTDGTLDPGFNNDTGRDANGFSQVAVQSDGRIYVCGSFRVFNGEPSEGVVRLHPDGSLDPGFRPDPIMPSGVARFALLPDGRIVIGGYAANPDEPARVARLTSDGALDPTFVSMPNVNATIVSLAVQSDGRIVIGGAFTEVNGTARFGLARLNVNGSLDLAFDPGLGVRGDDNVVNAIAIQSPDFLLIGGEFPTVDQVPRYSLARVRTGLPVPTGPGSLDITFDPTARGTRLGFAGGPASVKAVVTQPDGRVLVGGHFIGVDGVVRGSVARLNADSTLDPSFDPGLGADGEVTALALQADGKLLLAGSFTSVNGTSHAHIARLLSNGQVDVNFQCRLDRAGSTPFPADLAVQPDGRIVVCGAFTGVNGVARTNVARLNPDGSLDTSFQLDTAVPGPSQWIDRVVVQADGKVLLSGSWTTPARSLVRLLANGTLDTAFVPTRVTSFGTVGHIYDLTVQSDGRIAIVGQFDSVNGQPRGSVARLNADGSIDVAFDPGSFLGDSIPRTVLAEPGGRLVIGGWFTRVHGLDRRGLARFNTDGSVDPTFDPGTAIGHPGRPNVNALAAQPDGRIIVGADPWWRDNTNCVFRVASSGLRDTGFHVDLQAAADGLRAAALLPNGQVFVAGDFTSVNGVARPGVARLSADGTLDLTFHPDDALNFQIYALAVQPDGKLLLGGMGEFLDPEGGEWSTYAIARLNPDGRLDATFQSPVVEGAWCMIETIALQPDGRILIGGLMQQVDGVPYRGIARLNANGSLDTTFAPLPIYVGEDPGFGVEFIHVLPDGRMLIAGGFQWASGGFAEVARLNADGTVDTNFAVQIPDAREVYAFAVAPDGSMVLRDGAWTDTGWGRVLRLRADGSLDSTFEPAIQGEISALAIQPDGRVLMATNSYGVGGIVRLNQDGSLDTSWDTPLLGPSYPGARSLFLTSDECVVIFGGFTSVNGIPRPGIARLNNDLAGPGSFVTRRLLPQQVQLTATPPVATSVYAVEDQPPQNWHIEGISHGGAFDSLTGKVKFGPFWDGQARTLSYEILPTTAAPGTYPFIGTASADGVNSAIGGDQLYVIAGIHPADLDSSAWHLTIGEVTSYGAAWRRGENWPVPPVPIPINYVTRAAFLWRGGECYEIDPAATNPPLYWVNCGNAGFQPAVAQVTNLPSARRQMPAAFVPGETLVVTLSVSPESARAFAVEEQLPPNWGVTTISDGGEYDAVNGRLKWGPFFDNAPRTLSYEATPPPNVASAANFAGVVSLDGTSQTIAGSCALSEGCRVAVTAATQAGRIELSLSGRAGMRFIIEASSDLVTWTALGEVTAGATPTPVVDPAAAESSQRFYRARGVQ